MNDKSEIDMRIEYLKLDGSEFVIRWLYINWYVKSSVLRLISRRFCRIVVQSDYASEGTDSASVFVHTLVHYMISYVDFWFPLIR